ncbi:MAG: hypothetical protein R2850_10260 [Bacteroidia bacterium]
MRSVFAILLCLGLSIQAEGQNLEETYALGKEQYRLGLYQSSELALERVLFFGNGMHQPECLGLIGDIRMQQGKAQEAVQYYSRASKASNSYEQQVYYNLRKTSGLLADGNSMLAQIDLFSISENVSDSLLKYRNFLLGVAYFQQFDFDNGKASFLAALPENAIEERQQVDSLFTVLSKIKHPNPKTARIMSVFLPGLGQFYSGDIKNGINSLLLTGAFLTLGIHTAIKYTLLDAFGSVLPWFQRYYMGGYNRAEKIAEDRL